MGWAAFVISDLKRKKVVSIRVTGNSMKGKIKSGSLVQINPILDEDTINKGDIVLCKVKGKEYLHLVSAIKGNQYQISNNLGHVNGWITKESIYGKFDKILV